MILRLCLILILAGCQKKTAPVTDFSDLYSISSRFDQKTANLIVDITLDKRIHAYALGEKIGIPLKIELSPKNGWQENGEAIIPKGKRKNLKSLGESMVLEGDIHIEQKLKSGHGPGEASLHLQVCSDDMCDMPRVHNLKF
jgi:hypothetical protein